METMKSTLGNGYVRVGLTIALLAVIVWRAQPQNIVSSASRLGLWSLLEAGALTVPFLYLKSLRWFLMLRNARSKATFGQAFRSLVAGMGLALVTPARLGEVVRVAFLPDSRKVRLSALVMLDKFFDVLVLVLLSIWGAWTILGSWVGLCLLLVGGLGLVFVFVPTLFQPLILRLERRLPMNGRTHEVFSSLESLTPSATLSYLLLTLASFVLVIIQFGLILDSSTHVGPSVAFFTFPLVILTNVLPVTVAGLGVREGAAVLLLGHYGIGPGLAAVAAFAMFFLNTALPGIVGGLVPMFRGHRSPAAPGLLDEPNTSG